MMSRILSKEGIEKSGSEECNQNLYLAFQKEREKVQTTKKSYVYD